jgi:segregation and condensation protein A
VAYEVSTPVYEGPFDLLLHLITKEQVDLAEIRISAIVDAFLAEIERMQAIDLDVATEFLLIAATLVELKLRRLLPDRTSVDLDEELGLLEERDLLLAKLLEYQTFRQAANALRSFESAAGRSFPRTNVVEERFAGLSPDLLASVTPVQLRDAFVRAVSRSLVPPVAPRVVLDHVTEVRLTVSEAVTELAQELPRLGAASFRELVGTGEPAVVIVRFLAVLELFKQGWVDLDQTENFGVLTIRWRADGPDRDAEQVTGEAVIGARAAAERPTDESGEALDPDDVEADALIDEALARVRAVRIDVDDYEG